MLISNEKSGDFYMKLMQFKRVIRECDYSNTYKMAWAKAIVELSCNYVNYEDSHINISLFKIAEKMFKYYWDQTIFFNLFQSAPNQPPVILTEVKRIIAIYKSQIDEFKPIVFEKAKMSFSAGIRKELEKSIKKCISNIKVNVMPFFLNLGNDKYNFYVINNRNNDINVEVSFLKELYNNQDDLFDLINYRWSMILENYNSCPRIAKKVRIIDEQKIRRTKELRTFDEFLNLENQNHICFACGNPIEDKDLSRDHVIPWSYMYSDDLWNLVYVHKGCNSIKSDIIPTKETIEKLKQRNKVLKEKLHIRYQGQKSKILQEFDYAIENDYVDKFYLGCKGC